MAIKIVTPPVIEPVTLAEAKAQCRVTDTDTAQDALLSGSITAARIYCERIDWRAFLTQTIELWLDAWPGTSDWRDWLNWMPHLMRHQSHPPHYAVMQIPRPPLQSVASIKYYDASDVETTLDTSVYYVDTVSAPGRIVLRTDQRWPTTPLRAANGIVVQYTAGWTSAATVPLTIKQAILLLIGHWYENREASTVGAVSRAIELGVTNLLAIESAKRF
jgi:hypothetical protein